jgi:hypothetical protein
MAGLAEIRNLTPAACTFCTDSAKPPRDRNEVTASLAIGQFRDDPAKSKAALTVWGHLLRRHFPAWSQMAWSVAAAVRDWLGDGGRFTDTDTYRRRLEVCDPCANRDNHRCKLCGCFVRAKAGLPSESCPIGLW